DGRFKKNVKEDIAGLEFIEKLRPVSYEIDQAKLQSFLKTDPSTTGREDSQRSIGFIAQEVARLVEEKGYTFSGVEKPANEEQDHYSIRYAEFVIPLTKAVQELSALVKTQQLEMDELKKLVAALSNPGAETAKTNVVRTGVETNTSIADDIKIYPNPTKGVITISGNGSATGKIEVVNASGAKVYQTDLKSNTTQLDLSAYPSGIYLVTITSNGQTTTKKIILE
ncbi:MAG: T9SS type A sorting domain-containing protein, partial [Daejeonella sp.]